ncbi:hypothetical protein PCASD_07305 [Puccinia coronata f. sp. avenae]|uniref:Fork-head domain-containing protein n=1 Tax=Puccinia coronata f. sp. avenae TaxID=200324 RepID=A0A2N5URS8_9BASI|nr:hypothetical protein PCASD_07305 [Puccinia coronata f. sp. avenae]
MAAIPLDIVALSAEIFNSINEQHQRESSRDAQQEGEKQNDLRLDNTPTIDTQSLEYQLQQAVAAEEQFTAQLSNTEKLQTTLNDSLFLSHLPAEEKQVDHIPTTSLDDIFNQVDVSALIQSLLNADHLPPPDPLPPPPASPPPPSTPLLQSVPPGTSSHLAAHQPPAIIDPTLESTSSPITLSGPHSPEPTLRSDASTSQLPSLGPPPPTPQQQQQQQQSAPPHPSLLPPSKPSSSSSSSSSSATLLTPSSIKISSLDQLANPPRGQQPNYPWWTIIRAAIMGSRYGILNREEIFDALQRRWEYFRATSDLAATRVWKSAVGHNLSVKECFVRVHVEGKKNISYYIVDTAVDPAKGRLSKAKNSTSTVDRMSIPVITRKLVLPPDFDLSIQARWSPAIAAIRNAKYGYPTSPGTARPSSSSTSTSAADARSESDSISSSSDSETDSDDTATEAEPLLRTPHARPGLRLGSSLSAIIEQPSPSRRLQPIPRLAFSRSLSNALVATPPTSRRRNLPARHYSPSSCSTGKHTPPIMRPFVPRKSHLDHDLPANHSPPPALHLPRQPPQPLRAAISRSSLSPPPPPDLSSLQDHVNAALADVAASLPEMGTQPQPHPDNLARAQQESGVHNNNNNNMMMIDMHSSILDPLPEIDLDAILREAQAEVQEENLDNQPTNATVHLHGDGDGNGNDDDAGGLEQDVSSLMPTAADFDRLLASVISEHGEKPAEENSEAQQDLECAPLAAGSKRSTSDAGLHDFLQDLIDEAQQQQTGQGSSSSEGEGMALNGLGQPPPQPREEEAREAEATEAAFMEASRMLEAEIEAALKRAEEQEMVRAAELARAAEAQAAAAGRQRHDVQLTASGDIPVHPFPLAPHQHQHQYQYQLQLQLQTAVSPARSGTTTPHASRRSQTRPHRRPHPRPPAPGSRASTRPTLLRCLPHPPATSGSTSSSSSVSSSAVTGLAAGSTTSTLIDRRTRASGARTVGRRLNLPLPSSHTLPALDDPAAHLPSSSATSSFAATATAAATAAATAQLDESTLAPGFLDSIPVVSPDKPRATFPELAKDAILAHPSGKLTAAEIFKVLEKKYPYFVSAAESWKATLRNVLTSHSCFVKIPRPADAPGRGDWWATVDLPLWKRRRTTAKAKQDEDFVGRHAREHSRRQTAANTGEVREERGAPSYQPQPSGPPSAAATGTPAAAAGDVLVAPAADIPTTSPHTLTQRQDSLLIEPLLLLHSLENNNPPLQSSSALPLDHHPHHHHHHHHHHHPHPQQANVISI